MGRWREPLGRGRVEVDHDVRGHRPRLVAGVEHPCGAEPVDPAAAVDPRRLVDVTTDDDLGPPAVDPRGEIVIGGGSDIFQSYAQRGGLPAFEANAAAAVGLFPCLGRLRVMRQWAGLVDITPDTSPIMGLSPVDGLFLSAGWGTGGYKAIPAGGETMAWTIANGRPHELITAFGLERFARGALVDEGAASGVAH